MINFLLQKELSDTVGVSLKNNQSGGRGPRVSC